MCDLVLSCQIQAQITVVTPLFIGFRLPRDELRATGVIDILSRPRVPFATFKISTNNSPHRNSEDTSEENEVVRIYNHTVASTKPGGFLDSYRCCLS